VCTHLLSLLHYWRVVHFTPFLKGSSLLTFVVLQSANAVKPKLPCLYSTMTWLTGVSTILYTGAFTVGPPKHQPASSLELQVASILVAEGTASLPASRSETQLPLLTNGPISDHQQTLKTAPTSYRCKASAEDTILYNGVLVPKRELLPGSKVVPLHSGA
jgi:hypothetical protein